MKLFLLGRDIQYSRSPALYQMKQTNELEVLYGIMDVATLPDMKLLGEQDPDLLGFNVTIPYKTEILAQLDTLSPMAADVHAINTVVVMRENGKVELAGYNTDVEGFANDCLPWVHRPQRLIALILGTGGAAKAARVALTGQGWDVQLVSRTEGAAEHSYRSLTPDIIAAASLIVNATPLGQGSRQTELPPVPYFAIGVFHFCYDMSYTLPLSPFLQACAARGASTRNGLGMLEQQAEAAWALWTNALEQR